MTQQKTNLILLCLQIHLIIGNLKYQLFMNLFFRRENVIREERLKISIGKMAQGNKRYWQTKQKGRYIYIIYIKGYTFLINYIYIWPREDCVSLFFSCICTRKKKKNLLN